MTGTPKAYAKTADSGTVRLQHFCPDCGTPIFTSGQDAGVGEWVLRWGSIRQRDQLAPIRRIWCRSAEPWINDLARVASSQAG